MSRGNFFSMAIDFHVTCGAQNAANNRVQLMCAELDEDGPAINAITYSINGGSQTRGTYINTVDPLCSLTLLINS